MSTLVQLWMRICQDIFRDHPLILHHNSKVVVVVVVVAEGLDHLKNRGNGFFDKLHTMNTSK